MQNVKTWSELQSIAARLMNRWWPLHIMLLDFWWWYYTFNAAVVSWPVSLSLSLSSTFSTHQQISIFPSFEGTLHNAHCKTETTEHIWGSQTILSYHHPTISIWLFHYYSIMHNNCRVFKWNQLLRPERITTTTTTHCFGDAQTHTQTCRIIRGFFLPPILCFPSFFPACTRAFLSPRCNTTTTTMTTTTTTLSMTTTTTKREWVCVCGKLFSLQQIWIWTDFCGADTDRNIFLRAFFFFFLEQNKTKSILQKKGRKSIILMGEAHTHSWWTEDCVYVCVCGNVKVYLVLMFCFYCSFVFVFFFCDSPCSVVVWRKPWKGHFDFCFVFVLLFSVQPFFFLQVFVFFFGESKNKKRQEIISFLSQ